MNKKGQLVICLDYDGVIADSLAILKHLNHMYRMDIKPWEVDNYNLNKVYMQEIDWSDKPYGDLSLAHFHKYSPWQQNASWGIKFLMECPYVELYIISSRGKEGAEAAISMFDKELGCTPNLIFTGSEYEKIKEAMRCGCDMFFDDNPDTIDKLSLSGITVCRYAQPYNVRTYGCFGTVRNWIDLIEMIDYYRFNYIERG